MATIPLPSRAARATTTAAPRAVAGSPALVLTTVSLGYLLANWAMNPVSAILPTITADLGIDVNRAGWILNAYFIVLVAFVLIAGKLGDAFGHGVIFRLGCLAYAVGSVVAVFSSGFDWLLGARAIMGLGSAMIFGTSLAIVATAFPGSRLGWAVGILTMTSGVSSIVGVCISVAAVEHANWHWSFAVPILLGVGGVALGGSLPSVRRARAANVDWLGGALLVGTLLFFLLGLNHLHEGEETFAAGAPYHLSMHLAALGFLVAFLWRETRVRRPLIDLALFRISRLTAGVVANGIAHSSMLATSLLIPFLLERGRGYSPNETAEFLLVMQVANVAASFLGGWFYSRHGSPLVGIVSLASIAVGLLVMAQVGADLPFVGLFPIAMVLGAGLGVFSTVNNTAVMLTVTADQRGFAAGLIEATRQMGHSLGISVASGLLSAALAAATIPTLGYRDGFVQASSAMGLVAVAGVLIVCYPTLRRRLAPATVS